MRTDFKVSSALKKVTQILNDVGTVSDHFIAGMPGSQMVNISTGTKISISVTKLDQFF